jgi:hypothetical protein
VRRLLSRCLPWLFLVLTLVVALVRLRPPHTQPLPAGLRVGVVHGDLPAELSGARALFPLRGGLKGESWSIREVLETGSRSPLAPGAPRVTLREEPIMSETPTLLLSWREGERFGVACLTHTKGLLTSPSTRFTPGLLAATDIAATVQGKPFAAGRPAVLISGTRAELSARRGIWETKAKLLPYLVVTPWLLSLALVLATLRGKSLGDRRLWGGVALLLWGDLLLGSPLLERLPFSYAVTEAARFYGIGNDAAGLLFGCAVAAGFKLPLLLGVAVSIGAPSLGANNGCFLAALVGIVSVEVSRLPRKKHLWATLGALLGIGVLFFLLARWDASRGEGGRTHLGQALAEPPAGRLTLVGRKLAMNGHLLVSSPWSLLLLTSSALLIRRRAWQTLFAGGAALALNDSGVLAAATLLLPTAAQKEQSPLAPSEPGGC